MLIFSPYNKLIHPLALAAIILRTQNISYFPVHFIILRVTFFTTPCRPSSALTFPLSLPPNNSTSLSTVQTWVVRRAVWLPPLSNPSSSIPIAYNTTSKSQSSPLPWSDEWARCGAALQCRRGRRALPGLGGPVDHFDMFCNINIFIPFFLFHCVSSLLLLLNTLSTSRLASGAMI